MHSETDASSASSWNCRHWATGLGGRQAARSRPSDRRMRTPDGRNEAAFYVTRFLQCFDIIGWLIQRGSSLKKFLNQWKKHSEETQTLRTGCSKAEPIFLALLQTPFPWVWDEQKIISWRWSLPSPTDPVWWGSMHTISSYHGNRPTNK